MRDSLLAAGRRLPQQSRPVPAAAGVQGRLWSGARPRWRSRSSSRLPYRHLGAKRRQVRDRPAGAAGCGSRSRLCSVCRSLRCWRPVFRSTFSIRRRGNSISAAASESCRRVHGAAPGPGASTPPRSSRKWFAAGSRRCRRGQLEAARALGLSEGDTLRLIVFPQALRIIVPPLTSQYLNLVKNSSLAVAIGYPDLLQRLASTMAEPDRPGRSRCDHPDHGGPTSPSAS